jgi:hypothetical protein
MASIKDILNQKGALGTLASRHQLAEYKENTYYTFTAIYGYASPYRSKDGRFYINVFVTDLRDDKGETIDNHAWLRRFPEMDVKAGDKIQLRATVKQYPKTGKKSEKFIGYGIGIISKVELIS